MAQSCIIRDCSTITHYKQLIPIASQALNSSVTSTQSANTRHACHHSALYTYPSCLQ